MYYDKKKRINFINRILLILASVAIFFSVIYIPISASKRNHDGSRVEILVTSIHKDYSSNTYYVYMNYSVKNNTGKDIYCIDLRANVYDMEENFLGFLTTTIGSRYVGSSSLDLKVGDETDVECYISNSSLTSNEFFTTLYQAELNEMTFECTATSVYFTDGKHWRADD